MEALAEFHAKTGNTEYAVILYNHVLALLHNKRTGDTFLPEDLCRAATVLNNVAGVLMRGAPTPETLDTAEDFARRALEVLGDAAKNKKSISPEDLQTCAHTFAVTLFNIGSLREMHNDRDTARAFYQASLKRSKELDLPEGISEAKQALRRLDRESTPPPSTDITKPST
ncbi:hypothetical protein EWM64_g2349 [Hericium alpestre]|uniref:MalT-like TPR region domain-containing protein n=1 Tax=Hericium alpestre TaxID=135208 RepID=A0A4Z0A7Q2_9AGAM|nr:hypothetical protein EWM64_g2349 [Hericium alpestre]